MMTDDRECQAQPRLEMTPEQMINALQNVLKYSNVIDLALYNNTLTEYMFHWEGRAIEAEAEVERLKKALLSIAANTCCEGCQEAKLVARSALE